jgi:hypothetical protein
LNNSSTTAEAAPAAAFLALAAREDRRDKRTRTAKQVGRQCGRRRDTQEERRGTERERENELNEILLRGRSPTQEKERIAEAKTGFEDSDKNVHPIERFFHPKKRESGSLLNGFCFLHHYSSLP